ncbi:hypothetical protein AB0C27_34290 [Nonomuraea sp. NPDC048882]|uniref:hypothetical protein n=1 Tax=Nonomuraea sp. NPDC048882 TaxID=3154347 RepID=UPI0033CAA5A0
MRSALKKLCLATAAVMMMALPITTGTAYAADTAFNVKTQWLAEWAVRTMPMELVRREIWLEGDKGDYGWFTYVNPPAEVYVGAPCETYTGPIIEGTYIWTSQIWPGHPWDGWYRIDSYLTHKTGGAAYTIRCNFRIPGDGDYTWGSALDPHF